MTNAAKAGGARSSLSGMTSVRDELKSDRVAAELERRIVSGEVRAGERLPTEGELGEVLQVSRSVVRDAVRILIARGLVVVRQGQGMTVAEPSDAAFGHALVTLLARSDLTMGNVVDARATIETRLAPLAAESATEQDMDELSEALAQFAEAVEEHAWERAAETHLAFHVGLLHALHQPALELFLKPMTEVIMISSTPPRRTSVEDWEVDTHVPILESLKRRDAPGLEQAMADHFAATTEPRRYKKFRSSPFRDAFEGQIGS
jgi:GntR family transcriptional regulator, transcriptional repressor for pyruvate dehydrogenase complex